VTKRLSDAIARSGKGSKEVYDGLVLDADPAEPREARARALGLGVPH